MDAIQRHRPAETAWLAVTLAILSLGLAMIAWEWRTAHTSASPHTPAAVHNHRPQSSSEVTPAEGH